MPGNIFSFPVVSLPSDSFFSFFFYARVNQPYGFLKKVLFSKLAKISCIHVCSGITAQKLVSFRWLYLTAHANQNHLKNEEKVHLFLVTKLQVHSYISIHSHKWVIRCYVTQRSQQCLWCRVLPVRPWQGVGGADATPRNKPPIAILPRLLPWLRLTQGWEKSVALQAPLLLSGRCSGQRPLLAPSRGRQRDSWPFPTPRSHLCSS